MPRLYQLRVRSRRISSRLAMVPSLVYGLFYLLIIPLFALAYTVLGKDFYHSTVAFENALQSDRSRLLRALETDIKAGFTNFYGKTTVAVGKWIISADNLYLRSVEIKNDSAYVGLTVQYFTNDSLPIQVVEHPVIHISILPQISTFDPKIDWRLISFEQARRPPNVPAPPLPAFFPGYEGGSDRPLQLITKGSTTARLVAYANAVRGFPGEVSGRFRRMLYLSTVTVTTLGYGDIVPLTTTARSLVASESILGIILIGLFLNSLARETRQ